jgi:hypothetical protein
MEAGKPCHCEAVTSDQWPVEEKAGTRDERVGTRPTDQEKSPFHPPFVKGERGGFVFFAQSPNYPINHLLHCGRRRSVADWPITAVVKILIHFNERLSGILDSEV